MRNSRRFSILFKNDLTNIVILKAFFGGFSIKLIKAIHEKVKKSNKNKIEVTKFSAKASEEGIQVEQKS